MSYKVFDWCQIIPSFGWDHDRWPVRMFRIYREFTDALSHRLLEALLCDPPDYDDTGTECIDVEFEYYQLCPPIVLVWLRVSFGPNI